MNTFTFHGTHNILTPNPQFGLRVRQNLDIKSAAIIVADTNPSRPPIRNVGTLRPKIPAQTQFHIDEGVEALARELMGFWILIERRILECVS